MFAYFLYNLLHPLFYLKVSKISFSKSRLFPHADNPLLQETSFELVEHRSGVGVGGHVKLHPASQGSNHYYPSCGGGTRRRRGPESCLASLTECCDRVWWCTPSCPGSPMTSHAASIFFSLEAHQSYLLFSLHSFSFTFTILIFFV